jgi:hypothetical protein
MLLVSLGKSINHTMTSSILGQRGISDGLYESYSSLDHSLGLHFLVRLLFFFRILIVHADLG